MADCAEARLKAPSLQVERRKSTASHGGMRVGRLSGTGKRRLMLKVSGEAIASLANQHRVVLSCKPTAPKAFAKAEGVLLAAAGVATVTRAVKGRAGTGVDRIIERSMPQDPSAPCA